MGEGLPLLDCVQLVVDTTLVSPLRGDGSPRPNAAIRDGVPSKLQGAAERVQSWRWSGETLTCLRLLAEAKSRCEPPLLRRRAELAWRLRWTHLLSCAAARAFAGSLLERRLNGGRW